MGRSNPPRPGQPPRIDDARRVPPSSVHEKIALSFELYETGGDYCLSRCERIPIASFLECLAKLSRYSWAQLIAGSSKSPGMKTGMNSTLYARSDLRNPDLWPANVSPEQTLVGIRATERRRIFGVRSGNVFQVLWFDERHDAVKG